MGKHGTSGHYTAISKRRGKWYTFDDSKSPTLIKEADIPDKPGQDITTTGFLFRREHPKSPTTGLHQRNQARPKSRKRKQNKNLTFESEGDAAITGLKRKLPLLPNVPDQAHYKRGPRPDEPTPPATLPTERGDDDLPSTPDANHPPEVDIRRQTQTRITDTNRATTEQHQKTPDPWKKDATVGPLQAPMSEESGDGKGEQGIGRLPPPFNAPGLAHRKKGSTSVEGKPTPPATPRSLDELGDDNLPAAPDTGSPSDSTKATYSEVSMRHLTQTEKTDASCATTRQRQQTRQA
jgi:hypothetical protein